MELTDLQLLGLALVAGVALGLAVIFWVVWTAEREIGLLLTLVGVAVLAVCFIGGPMLAAS